ncbi:GerAB/ArcD/ProY family transporter [Paenibacillus sp. OAS669]|uniref:GerAB/ArcD/ProY family transporter n=1 Tax=Paenibacillus sp. OAS669 TaxID=2663821 RepID=UPI0017894E14|nr:GerAB/ArcD/ProY family transporter [Paenibacillus sp. OAS669]MBE1445633.1 spore germination protein KB [Paenibacillus sp. OAS669]
MRQITQQQLFMMFSIYLFTSTLGLYVNFVVNTSGYLAWLSVLLGACLSLLITYFSYSLAKRRPDQYFVYYGRGILTKWIHYPLVVFITICLLFITAFILHDLEDFIIQVYLPATPNWAIAVLFGVCFAVAVRCGIETIFRCAQGIFFISILGLLATPFFVKKEMDVDMAVAFINRFDFAQVWNGMWANASLYGETAFILYLFPKIGNPGKTMRTISGATFTATVVILMNILPAMLIFGPNLMANMTYPELELIRYIHGSTFFENLDPVLIALWITGLFIKISFLMYLIVMNLAQLFSLKDHKPLTLSTAILIIGMSLFVVGSTAETSELISNGLIGMIILIEVIPAFYLLVDRIRSFKTAKPK